MIKNTNYEALKTPCNIHYIGGTRYMYDTEHTFTLYRYPDLFIDDTTGQLYIATKFVKNTDIIEITEF